MTNNHHHIFRFRHFRLYNGGGLKVNTDSVLLGAWARHPAPLRILDAGSGNGLLSLMMAVRYAEASVEGVEWAEEAVRLSRHNLALNPSLAPRIHFYHTALADHIPAAPYDIMMSNPPYYDATPSPEALRNAARQNGRSFLEQLMRLAKRYLRPSGALFIIWPAGRRHHLLDTGYTEGLYPAMEIQVADHPLAPFKRSLWKWVKDPARTYRQEKLILFDQHGRRTPAFDDLVKNWYIS